MDNTTLTTTTQDPVTLQAKEILKTSSENAKELMALVTTNKWAVDIKGKRYLQVEAWQTLGKFYGLTARTSDEGVKYIEYGTAKGFEAKAEIVNELTGAVIGGATGICMDDEANKRGWANYALSGMAQTRAISRAYRQMLSFVAVTAGYEATPFEEMEAVVIDREPQAQVTEELASDAQKSFLVKLNVEFDENITKKQASELISKALAGKEQKKESALEQAVFSRSKDTTSRDDEKNHVLDGLARGGYESSQPSPDDRAKWSD